MPGFAESAPVRPGRWLSTLRSAGFLDGIQGALRGPLTCIGFLRTIEHRDHSSLARARLAQTQPGTMGSRLKALCPVRSVFVSVRREQRTDYCRSIASLGVGRPRLTPPPADAAATTRRGVLPAHCGNVVPGRRGSESPVTLGVPGLTWPMQRPRALGLVGGRDSTSASVAAGGCWKASFAPGVPSSSPMKPVLTAVLARPSASRRREPASFHQASRFVANEDSAE